MCLKTKNCAWTWDTFVLCLKYEHFFEFQADQTPKSLDWHGWQHWKSSCFFGNIVLLHMPSTYINPTYSKCLKSEFLWEFHTPLCARILDKQKCLRFELLGNQTVTVESEQSVRFSDILIVRTKFAPEPKPSVRNPNVFGFRHSTVYTSCQKSNYSIGKTNLKVS